MKPICKSHIKLFSLALIIIHLQGCAAAIVAGAAVAGGAYTVAQDRRSTGSIVDDQGIEFKAKHEISKLIAENEKTNINVISYNNNVLLIGQVPSAEKRRLIEKHVRAIPKVRHVHNEIMIGPITRTAQRTSDSWITAKIKSRMMAERELNSSRIKVITENGTVYLLGIVKLDEEEIATQIARETKGVKKVIKIFEPMAI